MRLNKKENLLSIIGKAQPVWRVLVSEGFNPGKELVSPDPFRHLDWLSVSANLAVDIG